jgi:transketolase
MRKAFVESLVLAAREDPRIALLTADLGYMALEPFIEEFPDRFFNVGVSEQNLIALATGLAEAGSIPFCYSIVNFSVLRPYEFIRNGPIVHQLPVKIVGMGGGMDYSTNGVSHYGIEDVGVLRVQPGIAIYTPADGEQTRTLLSSTASLPGPAYYRLGKDDRLVVPGLNGSFNQGKPEVLREGDDVLLLAMGGIALEAVEAADLLARRGIPAGVAVVSTLQPADEAFLADLMRPYRVVLSVEAHYRVGGIGSLAAEIIAGFDLPVRLVRCGLDRVPDGVTGSLPFMYSRYGIGREELAQAALSALAE